MTKTVATFMTTWFLIYVVLYLIWHIYYFKDTLRNWTNHKSLLWVTDFDKIKIIYCTGNGFIELYKGEFDIFTTCTDDENYQKYKHLWKSPIKYIKGYEDGYLVIQLWNTRKLNKRYGIGDDKK